MDRLTTWLWRYRGRVLAGFVALLVVDVAGILMPLVIREAIDRLSRGEGGLLHSGLYIVGLAVLSVLLALFLHRHLQTDRTRSAQQTVPTSA